jgi:hypothetical protein
MGKAEENRQFGRPENRWGNNIKMQLKKLPSRGRGLDLSGSE